MDDVFMITICFLLELQRQCQCQFHSLDLALTVNENILSNLNAVSHFISDNKTPTEVIQTHHCHYQDVISRFACQLHQYLHVAYSESGFAT